MKNELLLVSLIDGILKKKWPRFVGKSDHRGQTLNPMLLYTRYHKTYIQTHGTQNSVTLPLGDYWQACVISGYNPSSFPLSDERTKQCCAKLLHSISEV